MRYFSSSLPVKSVAVKAIRRSTRAGERMFSIKWFVVPLETSAGTLQLINILYLWSVTLIVIY